jgi:hypothetical protein
VRPSVGVFRKLYEYSEFGKADNKLELMSNILLRHNSNS